MLCIVSSVQSFEFLLASPPNSSLGTKPEPWDSEAASLFEAGEKGPAWHLQDSGIKAHRAGLNASSSP